MAVLSVPLRAAISNDSMTPVCNGLGGLGHATSPNEYVELEISTKIRTAAGIYSEKASSHNWRDFMNDKFDHKKLTASLTVNTDNTITNVTITDSSGSIDVDKKALDLISAMGPLSPYKKLAEKQVFSIEFPYLVIKPISKHP